MKARIHLMRKMDIFANMIFLWEGERLGLIRDFHRYPDLKDERILEYLQNFET